MDPSKIQNSGMKSTIKPNKLAYLPPGALAIRGRGKSLRSLGSVRVRVEKRTPINRSLNINPSTSYRNDPVQNIVPVPPGFDPTEDTVPCSPEVELMQDAQTNEINQAFEYEEYIVQQCTEQVEIQELRILL
ncbi:hypothetical protein H5410_014996 [Solanum commersonii]|uniref:Uncharacterized protein n=1 Tax=Solanum commersonii TaxID=4109 RepID=A0A9J5ZT27_SOLCO|nr:hypothetical protein H5410_014996 [Solanum commersonii]